MGCTKDYESCEGRPFLANDATNGGWGVRKSVRSGVVISQVTYIER